MTVVNEELKNSFNERYKKFALFAHSGKSAIKERGFDPVKVSQDVILASSLVETLIYGTPGPDIVESHMKTLENILSQYQEVIS